MNLPASVVDGFHSAAVAEFDRYVWRVRRNNPRYEMPADDAAEFIRKIEHHMRAMAFQKAIDPYIQQKCRYISIFARPGFTVAKDGSLSILEPEYPEEVRKLLAELDRLIEMAREQHGL